MNTNHQGFEGCKLPNICVLYYARKPCNWLPISGRSGRSRHTITTGVDQVFSHTTPAEQMTQPVNQNNCQRAKKASDHCMTINIPHTNVGSYKLILHAWSIQAAHLYHVRICINCALRLATSLIIMSLLCYTILVCPVCIATMYYTITKYYSNERR